MDLGMIGLGRMGNMARRLMRGGHRVVGWATAPAAVDALVAAGGTGARSLDDLVEDDVRRARMRREFGGHAEAPRTGDKP